MATLKSVDLEIAAANHYNNNNQKRVADIKTLGHLRLRDADTQSIILVPTPSSDLKDPLNW